MAAPIIEQKISVEGNLHQKIAGLNLDNFDYLQHVSKSLNLDKTVYTPSAETKSKDIFELLENSSLADQISKMNPENKDFYTKILTRLITEVPYEDLSLAKNETPEGILNRLIILSKRRDFEDLVVNAKIFAKSIRAEVKPSQDLKPQALGFANEEELIKFFSVNDLTSRSYIDAMIEEKYPEGKAEKAFMNYAFFNYLFPEGNPIRKQMIRKLGFPKDLEYFSRYELDKKSKHQLPEIDPNVVQSALSYSNISLN